MPERKQREHERGPDKQKRATRTAKKLKPPEEKVKTRPVMLNDKEDEYLITKFGGRTKAIKTLLPKKLFPTKKK